MIRAIFLRRPQTAVLLLAAVCWLPYFAGRVVPFHDSAEQYQRFHSFYSELLFNHDLLRWYPNVDFGVPADIYQNSLHPPGYVMMALGTLLGAGETLVLDKLADLLKELLFVFGLFRLGGLLYRDRLTQLLVSTSGALSISWLQESPINLSVFYLLPLVMDSLVRFFKTGKVSYFFLAGVIQVCSVIGSVPYYAPLQAIVLAIFALALCFEYPAALRSLLRLRSLAHPLLPVMLVATAVIGGFLTGAPQGLALLSPDRDPSSGHVSLSTFQNYARMPLATTGLGYLAGAIPQGDNTYYVGLLPIIMFVYALFTVRNQAFLGASVAFLALFWLSLGGEFAHGFYYLPGMRMFRHVGLVFGIGSTFLLVAGGFGLDRAICRLRGRDVPDRPRLATRLAWLAVVGVLLAADAWYCWRPYEWEPRFVHPGAWPFVVFRGALYLVAILIVAGMYLKLPRGPKYRSVLLALLALVMLLDIGSFRVEVFATIECVPRCDRPAGVFAANRLSYLAERGRPPPDSVFAARLKIFTRPLLNLPNNSHYLTLCPFAGIDPYQPLFRGDFLCPGTDQLIRMRGGAPTARPTAAYLPAHDAALLKVLAAQQPKLRLTRQVKVVPTEAEAENFMASLSDIFATTTIISDEASAAGGPGQTTSEPAPGSIQVADFSSNRIRLQVNVQGSEPAWLIYADAWHPGWKASMDAASTRVARADLAFKAVRVPPGAHDIEMVFAPGRRNVLAWGVALIGTGFGLALIGALFGTTLLEGRGRQ